MYYKHFCCFLSIGKILKKSEFWNQQLNWLLIFFPSSIQLLHFQFYLHVVILLTILYYIHNFISQEIAKRCWAKQNQRNSTSSSVFFPLNLKICLIDLLRNITFCPVIAIIYFTYCAAVFILIHTSLSRWME